uniref:Coilin_N domain-containing protein n=1 Tax=Anopheles minimus TaxID=112268 RepID=A0A182WQ28_9DIPT
MKPVRCVPFWSKRVLLFFVLKMKRYLLDLSELYTDHRKKAYIGYRTAWTTVGCVIRTIQNTFHIESDVYICSEDGIFYPAMESVELIRDETTLKVLPTVHEREEKIVSDDEPPNWRVTHIQQESSRYEDIESVLSGLPKPKRRRVRKRKIKQVTNEEVSSQPVPQEKESVQQTDTENQHQQNGHIRFCNEESQSSDSSKLSEKLESELPYRNLNRTMKARVVRAVTPSALIKQTTETPKTIAPNDAASAREPIRHTSEPAIKARIVRPIVCTFEVKQEQLEARAEETNAGFGNAPLQQSYLPQTVENSDVITIDSPTPVNGREPTHDTATPTE